MLGTVPPVAPAQQQGQAEARPFITQLPCGIEKRRERRWTGAPPSVRVQFSSGLRLDGAATLAEVADVRLVVVEVVLGLHIRETRLGSAYSAGLEEQQATS